jgi:ribonucleotide monophosphatase NagD (HAD superfamily)
MAPFHILAVVLLGAHGVQLGEEDAALDRRHLVLSKLNALPFAERQRVMKMASAPFPTPDMPKRRNSMPDASRPNSAGELAMPQPKPQAPYQRGVEIPHSFKVQRFESGSDVRDPPPPPLYDPSGESEKQVTGFLIDLDGTTYRPGSLVSGAKCFYQWMIRNEKQFVFLSNTGAKTSSGTQAKLSDKTTSDGKPNQYKITSGDEPIPINNIYTAAEAQIDMMAANIPMNARLFVLSGFAKANDLWEKLEAETDKWDATLGFSNRFKSWTIKTALSLEEAQNWGVESLEKEYAAGGKGIPTFVVMFVDGELAETDPLGGHRLNQKVEICREGQEGKIKKIEKSPETAACYESDWSFNLFTKISAILGPGNIYSGATLIYTADDPYNPTRVTVPGFTERQTFPLPGPGMFADVFRKMMYPNWHRIWSAGKGGSKQNGEVKGGNDKRTDHAQITHMYGNALKRLAVQKFGHEDGKTADYVEREKKTGIVKNVVMIGDRFDTDIAGGMSARLKTVLVTSGTHQETNQKDYPNILATWYARNLGEMAPNEVCKKSEFYKSHLDALPQSKALTNKLAEKQAKGLQHAFSMSRVLGNMHR